VEFFFLLEGWVLQDGNYPDFVSGARQEFAIEFDVRQDRPLRYAAGGEIGHRFTGSYSHYQVTGEVVHVRDAFVLDFGIRAYCNHLVPYQGRTVCVGDRLSGTVSLAVDPFFYFEQLAQKRGMPPLVYSWNVTEVQLDTPKVLTQPQTSRGRAGGLWIELACGTTHQTAVPPCTACVP
jgi:hypothetical protein